MTEKEVRVLDKLLTCPKCGSRKVEILFTTGKRLKGCYVRECLNCGYCEKLEGLKWNEMEAEEI